MHSDFQGEELRKTNEVCYLGRRSRRSNSLPEGTNDVLELLWDIWDDYGMRRAFLFPAGLQVSVLTSAYCAFLSTMKELRIRLWISCARPAGTARYSPGH